MSGSTIYGAADRKGKKMFKRILAMVGIILLVGTYIATLVCAIMATPAAKGMFFTSLGMTIVVPVIMWVLLRLYDMAHANDDTQISMEEMHKYNKRLKQGEDPEKIAKEIEERYGVNNTENK